MIRYMWRCYKAYQAARNPRMGFFYFTLSRYGVPETVVVIGRGREAWRVSDFAANYLAGRGA